MANGPISYHTLQHGADIVYLGETSIIPITVGFKKKVPIYTHSV